MKQNQSAYAAAGVDIDVMMNALQRAKHNVRSTYTPGVKSELGSFGGIHTVPAGDSVLVSSIDGVGTKLKVASMAGVHTTVGQDLVNHCVNDILVQGAKPLFFMDYIGAAKLDPQVFEDVVAGLCTACRENQCALLGGETAEMPGLYPNGEYDLVGTIVGTVEKKALITGEDIRVGDIVLGMQSTGFQTNGYSLVRKVIFEQAGLTLADEYPGTGRSVQDVLLAVHKSYYPSISTLMKHVTIHGMAHITGGGLVDNIPRVLPAHCAVNLVQDSWEIPSACSFIEKTGSIAHDEMYRVFNMGIGFTVFVAPDERDKAVELLRASGEHVSEIGFVVDGVPSIIWQ